MPAVCQLRRGVEDHTQVGMWNLPYFAELLDEVIDSLRRPCAGYQTCLHPGPAIEVERHGILTVAEAGWFAQGRHRLEHSLRDVDRVRKQRWEGNTDQHHVVRRISVLASQAH